MKGSSDNNNQNQGAQRPSAAPGSAPIDKTSPDGNINRSEAKHVGGASPSSVGSPEANRSTTGQHGGNHGNDRDNRNEQPASGENAKGSSNRGGQVPTSQQNQGGGQDTDHAKHNQNQRKGESNDYANGSLSRSSANDGGTIDDSNNRDAK
ncbi:hypothetical protein [Solirubrum puertoriconensis]|uniref:Uncharacterized protein n=1 Tax=Solirubrum puertoriconensis TaxID=1751427 RepID=A0A9X0HJC4_SOLP1|nr:hypothetical protein [Solirubrum puertoriconensis]KUG06972.1 hypothetical protein ASU33_06525 [Solirubrum puertoriconensis]